MRLANWETTRDSLHRAAQVLGAFRKRMVERQPNYRHLSLQVIPAGLTTEQTAHGEIILDFQKGQFIYGDQSIDLKGQTQTTLVDALQKLLPDIEPDRTALTSPDPLQIDSQLAGEYAALQYAVFQGMDEFCRELPGKKETPVLFPHHFDVSFLWFTTDNAEESAPHMNFGFAPYSPGLDRPYLYSYAYPLPENVTRLPLPDKTRWHTEGWTGTVTHLDDFPADIPAFVQQTFRQIYETVAPLMR